MCLSTCATESLFHAVFYDGRRRRFASKNTLAGWLAGCCSHRITPPPHQDVYPSKRAAKSWWCGDKAAYKATHQPKMMVMCVCVCVGDVLSAYGEAQFSFANGFVVADDAIVIVIVTFVVWYFVLFPSSCFQLSVAKLVMVSVVIRRMSCTDTQNQRKVEGEERHEKCTLAHTPLDITNSNDVRTCVQQSATASPCWCIICLACVRMRAYKQRR